jgi:hypothetical protein
MKNREKILECKAQGVQRQKNTGLKTCLRQAGGYYSGKARAS